MAVVVVATTTMLGDLADLILVAMVDQMVVVVQELQATRVAVVAVVFVVKAVVHRPVVLEAMAGVWVIFPDCRLH